MPELREVFEMTTKQVEPDLDAWREQEGRQRRSARNRSAGALAIAAAICIAAIVAIVTVTLGTRGGQDVTTPANEPLPVTSSAEEVATGFVEAFGAFDGERAITYLADNAYLQMDATTPEEVPVFTSLLEAMGYRQILVDPCRVTSTSASRTAVHCPFDWYGIRSDEIGLGPYPGYWDLTISDGEIDVVSLYWDTKKFSPQMWEPFRDWVSKHHPRDFAVMYVDGGGNFSLTKESARLWEQRSKEYVEVVRQKGDTASSS